MIVKTKIKPKINYLSSINNILKRNEKKINNNYQSVKNHINSKKSKNEKVNHCDNIKTSSVFQIINLLKKFK